MACRSATLAKPPRIPDPPIYPRKPFISHERKLVMPSDPEIPIEEAIADGFETRYPLRTHILASSSAFWVRGGKSMVIHSNHNPKYHRRRHRRVVLERHPDSVRVILDSRDVRLAAFFPVNSLQPTPVFPMKLIQPGVKTDAETGITVFPSIDGRWQRRRDGFWQFTSTRGGIHFKGKLPVSRVTWVFDPGLLIGDVPTVTHLVRNGTVIRDQPDGGELARLHDPHGSSWIHGVTILKRTGGDVQVALERKEFRIQGWIKKTELKKISKTLGMRGHGYGVGGWGSSRQIMVDSGTRLFACPDGPQVGIVLKRTAFGDEGSSGNGFRSLYRYDSELGFAYSVCIMWPAGPKVQKKL